MVAALAVAQAEFRCDNGGAGSTATTTRLPHPHLGQYNANPSDGAFTKTRPTGAERVRGLASVING